jgi:hypothetical protein
MSQIPQYGHPSDTPAAPQPRSFATWMILLAVWTIGLVSCIAWIAAIGYLLIRLFTV